MEETAAQQDEEWEAIRRDLETTYGGPLSLDADDLRLVRDICLEARRQHGRRGSFLRFRELMA